MTFTPDPKPKKREKRKVICSATGCNARATEKYNSIMVCNSHYKRLATRKKPRKAIKKKSNRKYSIALDKARKIFQKYVRLRDSDDQGVCKCISCGKSLMWTDKGGRMQGGHYHKAELYRNVLFNEDNVHSQCAKCNKNMGTPEVISKYTSNLIKKIGQERFDQLDKIKSIQVKLDTFYMLGIQKDYNEKFDQLYKEKFG